jgi:hypothetical protein
VETGYILPCLNAETARACFRSSSVSVLAILLHPGSFRGETSNCAPRSWWQARRTPSRPHQLGVRRVWRLLADELYPRVLSSNGPRFKAPGRCSLSCPSAARPWLAVQRRRRRAATVQIPQYPAGHASSCSSHPDEKEGLPVARSRARLMSDVAWTVAHACRSARPHDGDYFARRYLAQRLPLQRSSQDWWRSPEVCKGRRNAHVGVGLITIAHHEKNLMVLLPSWPACL